MPGIKRRASEQQADLTYSQRRRIRDSGSGWERRKRQYDKLVWWEQWGRDVKAIYALASRLKHLTGVVHSVDHIVPLKHSLVCGLHVPWNMSVMTLAANMSKGNNWWPGMPYEQQGLFDEHDNSYRNFDYVWFPFRGRDLRGWEAASRHRGERQHAHHHTVYVPYGDDAPAPALLAGMPCSLVVALE